MDSVFGREPATVISRHLDPGEELLWVGVPRQGLLFRSSDWLLVPFSLLSGAFAVFWEATVLTDGAPIFFAIWGIPIIAAAVYFIVGRFFVDRRARARTFYGLTPHRIIILSGLRGTQIKSINLRSLSDISLSESSNGSGTIPLGAGRGMGTWLGASSWPGASQYGPPQLELARGARDVYNRIRAAQQAA